MSVQMSLDGTEADLSEHTHLPGILNHKQLTESLLDTFLVVVFSAACLASFNQPWKKFFFRARQEQNECGFADLIFGRGQQSRKNSIDSERRSRRRTYLSVELDRLLHLTRETVDEEFGMSVFHGACHGFLH